MMMVMQMAQAMMIGRMDRLIASSSSLTTAEGPVT
ncbi:Uncharacterised protein [Mycobacteroides abscessus]|nr:Uncharacterised protein [Mycobacteroides abscessus]SHQ98611.1 Uncharacterised protein [Mycobacteroides abscessus subsp. abscessus]SKG81228.1 Uncharacterised protein [Mycobacteroides abscessus subsp. bolletii]SLD65668.1 Uncharacterised protein [Mycobacteroides abscessus subsp. massiliense]SHV00423.1 Uncharacterised protein [Mycobacteroides abscessus subsp. abscessus]